MPLTILVWFNKAIDLHLRQYSREKTISRYTYFQHHQSKPDECGYWYLLPRK